MLFAEFTTRDVSLMSIERAVASVPNTLVRISSARSVYSTGIGFTVLVIFADGNCKRFA